MVPVRLASNMLGACERADREGPQQIRLPQPRVETTLVSPGIEPRTPLRYLGNETVLFERALDIRDRTPTGYVDHPITRLHGLTERGSGTAEWTLAPPPHGTRTTMYGVFRVVFDESDFERYIQLAITPVSRESRTSPSPPSPSAP